MAEEAAAKPVSTRTSTYWNGDLIFGGKCTIENVSFIKPHSLKNILLNNNINVDNNSQSLLKLGEEAGDFHDSEFLPSKCTSLLAPMTRVVFSLFLSANRIK